MIEVRQTEAFSDWLSSLKDVRAKARIAERVRRMALGNFGDAKSVGQGVSELRIDYGPGYRAYFVRRDEVVVLLLCGGDKSTQQRDVRRAHAMAKEV
jgi:putative addiction module killer protein